MKTKMAWMKISGWTHRLHWINTQQRTTGWVKALQAWMKRSGWTPTQFKPRLSSINKECIGNSNWVVRKVGTPNWGC
jgi:hypothetical protein